MNSAPVLVLHWNDWFSLFTHYLSLSLMAVGGAATTLPEMHRYLVDQVHWLSDEQFRASVAIAQASPGPNVLYVVLLGWNVGVNAGGLATALLGGLLSVTGMLLPSTNLAYLAARWVQRNRDLPGVRAFKQGMSPIVISLLLATGWIFATAHNQPVTDWPLWLVTAATTLIIWRSGILTCSGCSPPVLRWVYSALFEAKLYSTREMQNAVQRHALLRGFCARCRSMRVRRSIGSVQDAGDYLHRVSWTNGG